MTPSRRSWILDRTSLFGSFALVAAIALVVLSLSAVAIPSRHQRGDPARSAPKLELRELLDLSPRPAPQPLANSSAGTNLRSAGLESTGASAPALNRALSAGPPAGGRSLETGGLSTPGLDTSDTILTRLFAVVAAIALALLALLVSRNLRHRRALAADVLRQSETLRVTLASIGDGVLTTDLSGRVLYLNGEAESLTGWKSGEAKGEPIEKVFRIVNEETRQPVENPASKALSEGVMVGLASHTILIGRDGSERPIGDIAAPIRDARGGVAGVVLIFRDVTEERAATNQLRQLATELSEADGRKNEFLAMLAHEIRNPLAAIRNSVAVLRLAGLDPHASAAAQGAIHRQMEHLARLVDDLLDVSRISHGKLALRRSRVDLRPALDQAVEAHRASFESMGQRLEVDLPAAPLAVDADATRITQAIGNLLNNASKFTQRAGEIHLSAARENGQVVVRIRDNGIGISPEHLTGLFDMFSQVDTSLERTQDGLGIGLHLVKQLVEMHGGQVEARSDGIGFGSEFVVRLPAPAAIPAPRLATPACEGAPSPAGAEALRDAAKAKLTTRESGRRILVVDDNVDSADSLAMLLRLKGHEAAVAHDGLEAVEVALRTLPDVVLLDIGLPKLNGYETARRIRSSPRGSQIRLIALTGRGQSEDLKLANAAGFDAHLVKPVDLERLLAFLARSWTAPGAQPAPAVTPAAAEPVAFG